MFFTWVMVVGVFVTGLGVGGVAAIKLTEKFSEKSFLRIDEVKERLIDLLDDTRLESAFEDEPDVKEVYLKYAEKLEELIEELEADEC